MSPKSSVSTLNPNPREMLSSMIPDARPSWRNRATAASPEIFVDRIALVIPTEPRTTTMVPAHIGAMSQRILIDRRLRKHHVISYSTDVTRDMLPDPCFILVRDKNLG